MSNNRYQESFRIIYDAINYAEEAWELYRDIDDKSPESGWEDFVMSLATEIHAALVDEDLGNLSKKDRLQAEIDDLENKIIRMNDQIEEAEEEIKVLEQELNELD